VVVPLVPGRSLPILYGLHGTPLNARETLLATVVPKGSAIAEGNIPGRTDPSADAALVALLIDPKLAVHSGDFVESDFVKERKDNSLPQRSPFYGTCRAPYDVGCEAADLRPRSVKELPLFFLRPRSPPRDVIGRHGYFER